MKKPELAIAIILRVIGISGLFAIPAIFLPYSWMNAIHAAGMPAFWTRGEGPPTIVVGLVVLWLQRKITVKSEDHEPSMIFILGRAVQG